MTGIVEEYFARVRARDIGMVELFHDDARLIGLGGEKAGKEAIRSFYTGVIERAGPTPTLVGGLMVSGNRVGAEIQISLEGGATVHAVDLFVVEDGRIRSLTYFLASH
jgi:hypothetical protein